MSDDDRLGSTARGLIEDISNEVLVSIVTVWEIAMKVRAGKLQADIPEAWETIIASDFTTLGLTVAHLRELMALPMPHKDPFDHLLIAQAIAEGAVFVFEDRNTPYYPVDYITCSDASP